MRIIFWEKTGKNKTKPVGSVFLSQDWSQKKPLAKINIFRCSLPKAMSISRSEIFRKKEKKGPKIKKS